MCQLGDLGQTHNHVCSNFFKFCVYGTIVRTYRIGFRVVTVKRITVILNSIFLSLVCEKEDNLPSQNLAATIYLNVKYTLLC